VGSVCVSSGGHDHIDHLAELVDRPVDIAPSAGVWVPKSRPWR
jgi:hypothetical protein